MSRDDRQKSKKSPPWEEGQEEAARAFGRWLRQQREVREVGLREVADTTKIGLRYLEAFEDGRFELLPAPVFARGFLREYARYVGLNPDEVVNSYLTAGGFTREREEERSTPSGSGRPRWLVLAALAVLMLVAGVWIWLSTRPSEPPSPAGEGAARTSPAGDSIDVDGRTTSPVREPGERAAPLVVTLDFTGRSWVDAVVDGEPKVGQEHVQGESLTLTAQEAIVLTLSDPGAVEVLVNGQPRRPQPGPGGRVTGWEIVAPQEGAPVAPQP